MPRRRVKVKRFPDLSSSQFHLHLSLWCPFANLDQRVHPIFLWYGPHHFKRRRIVGFLLALIRPYIAFFVCWNRLVQVPLVHWEFWLVNLLESGLPLFLLLSWLDGIVILLHRGHDFCEALYRSVQLCLHLRSLSFLLFQGFLTHLGLPFLLLLCTGSWNIRSFLRRLLPRSVLLRCKWNHFRLIYLDLRAALVLLCGRYLDLLTLLLRLSLKVKPRSLWVVIWIWRLTVRGLDSVTICLCTTILVVRFDQALSLLSVQLFLNDVIFVRLSFEHFVLNVEFDQRGLDWFWTDSLHPWGFLILDFDARKSLLCCRALSRRCRLLIDQLLDVFDLRIGQVLASIQSQLMFSG